jgi:ankyrin repeat protein
LDIVENLLEKGADTKSSFTVAVFFGHCNIAKFLIGDGMQLDLDNETSLLEALLNNHEHVHVKDLQPLISRLIDRGC